MDAKKVFEGGLEAANSARGVRKMKNARTEPEKGRPDTSGIKDQTDRRESVTLSSFHMTLGQKVRDYFNSFPQLASEANKSPDGQEPQKAAFALEASYRASVTSRFEEADAGGKIQNYITHTEEAEVSINIKMMGEVGKKGSRAKNLAKHFSPENVSGRVAEFAVGFYDGFVRNHPGLSEGEAKAAFGEMAAKAIEKGFGQARQIVGDISGQADADMNRTHELTMQKLISGLGI